MVAHKHALVPSTFQGNTSLLYSDDCLCNLIYKIAQLAIMFPGVHGGTLYTFSFVNLASMGLQKGQRSHNCKKIAIKHAELCSKYILLHLAYADHYYFSISFPNTQPYTQMYTLFFQRKVFKAVIKDSYLSIQDLKNILFVV